MRLYETTFITDSQLSESEIETEIRKVEELITANGGKIVETQRWGIKRFAYEVGHKRQGYYTHVLYHGTIGIPALLEGAFKVNERIVRFLTVASDVDLEALQKPEEPPTPQEVIIPPVERPVTEPERPGEEETRDIDMKESADHGRRI